MLVDKKICIIKSRNSQDMTLFHIDNLNKTRAELQIRVPISILYHIPVLIISCIDLERLPTMSPKISIVYSVSSLRSVMAMLRSSPPSTSSLGWPGPSVWLTIITNVSKESSSANHVSLKPSGVTSETRRACTSGSVSEWQGKVNFASLCEECFHISGTFQWKTTYQSLWECKNWLYGSTASPNKQRDLFSDKSLTSDKEKELSWNDKTTGVQQKVSTSFSFKMS